MLREVLQDCRLPEQCARVVAARPVDLAELLVQLALLERVVRGAGALQEPIGNPRGRRTRRRVALGRDSPELGSVTFEGQEGVARGRFEVTGATAFERGFGQQACAILALAARSQRF